LLLSDDDDYEHFGFMGSKIAQTPTLDKLVANGTLFTTAHCPAPLCRPSLASMLSGRLPNQHGIYGNYIDRSGIGKDTIAPPPIPAPARSQPSGLKRQFPSSSQAYWSQRDGKVAATQRIRGHLAGAVSAHYRNYPSVDFPNWEQAYYGVDYAKLQELKLRYDPDNLFRHQQNVRLPGQ
jgi:hypothetical protein